MGECDHPFQSFLSNNSIYVDSTFSIHCLPVAATVYADDNTKSPRSSSVAKKWTIFWAIDRTPYVMCHSERSEQRHLQNVCLSGSICPRLAYPPNSHRLLWLPNQCNLLEVIFAFLSGFKKRSKPKRQAVVWEGPLAQRSSQMERDMSCFQTLLTAFREPNVIRCNRRASVAIVLRHPECVSHAMEADLARPPQVLFIQRTPNPRDPFSAHIAFPGGRQDTEDESDLHTAIREAQEEIGLNLSDSSKFKLLGRLNDRHITRGGKKQNSVYCAFVFEQLPRTSTPPLVLQPSEVASAFWVSFSMLNAGSPAVCEHKMTVSEATARKTSKFTADRDGGSQRDAMITVSMPAIEVLRNGQDFVHAPNVSAPSIPLWGLTLSCIGDISVALGKERID